MHIIHIYPYHEAVVTCKKYADEIETVFASREQKEGTSLKPNYWLPPCAGKIKLNSDGSKLGEHGIAGYGGVLRDEDGLWIKGYMGQIGHSSILEAELWGIYRGLIIIYEMNLQDVSIETDSQDAASCIAKESDSSFPLHFIREEIKHLLARCSSSIKVIPREINEVADWLAKSGRNQSETLVILDEAPIDIHDLVIQDMIHCSKKCT